jgi:ADP-heptose:LPS heptosyltransferase
MSNKRILFCQGEGIGNVIQCIPVIRTLKEVLGYSIDFWHTHGSYHIPEGFFPHVDKWFVGKHRGKAVNLNASEYHGAVSAIWCKVFFNKNRVLKIPLLTKKNVLTTRRSEVDTYMDIARELGVKEEDIIWHGECNYKKMNEEYDIVIHNGYNRKGAANWKIKSYPYYEKVVALLVKEGFKVCSVGLKEEYIKGTVNKTGLDLLSGLGLIKNSKLFLGNDSGLYHCANALGIKNVVIFTATSITKNYDKRFHKYSELIYREDLKCRPCQANQKWRRDCKNWKCREIAPEIIVNKIKETI